MASTDAAVPRRDLVLPRHVVVDVVTRALAEDLTPLGDLTSALLPRSLRARAHFVARTGGVVAGTQLAVETFRQVGDGLEAAFDVVDGDRVEAGRRLGVVEGVLADILTGERTALNLLSHLSGVATATARFVDAAASRGGTARVWDTRKTTPGLRTVEKHAVRAGGGRNHRGNLSDWILLKDNHLALLGIEEAVALARDRWPGRTVHVECDRLDQVKAALAAGADALLLDNMTVDQVRECVAAAEAHAAGGGGRRPLLEVSGGVTLDTIADYATTGVDMISVGAITNSAPVLDIGLDILEP